MDEAEVEAGETNTYELEERESFPLLRKKGYILSDVA